MKKKKHVDAIFESKDKKYSYFFKQNNFNKNTYNIRNSNFSKLNYFFGIQAKESGKLTLNSIKAVIKLIKWGNKKYKLNLNFKFNFFPDFVLTSKPKEVRMGKGKGKPSSKVACIKRGQILLEFSNVQASKIILLEKLLKNCKIKLNLKSHIVKNIWKFI